MKESMTIGKGFEVLSRPIGERGRMREKLDDDLPELTEGVVSLLWPHYLRTIPRCRRSSPRLAGNERIDDDRQGFEVLSRPIGERARAAVHHQSDALQPLSRNASSWPPIRSVITLRMAGGRSRCALPAAS